MTRLLVALAWIFALCGSALSMEPNGRRRIGDLTYDPARWDVHQRGDSFDIVCRGKDCDVAMVIRIDGEGPPCDSATAGLEKAVLDSSHDRSFRTIRRPGFDIHVAFGWAGCRNARPPSVHACTVYKGRTYRFSAPVFGCKGGPGFGDGALDFLEQLGAE